MTRQTLQDRLDALETKVARLETDATAPKRMAPTTQTMDEFLEDFSGIFEDDPIFLEAMKLGAEWRESSRPKAKSTSRKRRTHARPRH